MYVERSGVDEETAADLKAQTEELRRVQQMQRAEERQRKVVARPRLCACAELRHYSARTDTLTYP